MLVAKFPSAVPDGSSTGTLYVETQTLDILAGNINKELFRVGKGLL